MIIDFSRENINKFTKKKIIFLVQITALNGFVLLLKQNQPSILRGLDVAVKFLILSFLAFYLHKQLFFNYAVSLEDERAVLWCRLMPSPGYFKGVVSSSPAVRLPLIYISKS